MTENKMKRKTIEDAQEEYEAFTEDKQTIILSTVDKEGVPNASYAPYVQDDQKNMYVYVSGLSKHTSNLESTGQVSVMMIDDESSTEQVFARRRLTYSCKAQLFNEQEASFEKIAELFESAFGKMIQHFHKMPDFRIIQLIPQSGLFVIGFGAAYQVKGEDLNTLVHLTGEGKGHGHAHGSRALPSKPVDHGVEETLKDQYEALKQSVGGRLFPRDAAKKLNVSEMEILMTGMPDDVVPLRCDVRELFGELIKVGHVMSLTRNEYAVSEIKAELPKVKWPHGSVGITTGDIDLRIFSDRWKYAFAQIGEKKCIQFFNPDGNAIYKLYLTDKSHVSEFEKIIEEYTLESEIVIEPIQEIKKWPAVVLLNASDRSLFRGRWDGLTDVHDFLALIQEFKLTRLQALKEAGDSRAQILGKEMALDFFQKLSDQMIPVMLFVANPDMIQIYDGRLKNIKPMAGWINVMDPNFNLHLREEGISSVWWVERPTKNDSVQSLEIYDTEGELVLQIFHSSKGVDDMKKENSHKDWTGLLGSYRLVTV